MAAEPVVRVDRKPVDQQGYECAEHCDRDEFTCHHSPLWAPAATAWERDRASAAGAGGFWEEDRRPARRGISAPAGPTTSLSLTSWEISASAIGHEASSR